MIKFGTLEIPSIAILAPMAGVTDLTYRELNRKFGCKLAFTEMINARGLSLKNTKTMHMLTSSKNDQPLGIQLFEHNEKYLGKAIDILENHKYDILDLNAACPAPKIVKKGNGSALLKEPEKLEKILKFLVKHSTKPVSIKIRTGWDTNTINAVKISKMAQDSGLSAVFVHGRTRNQHYSGNIDYKTIGEVKKNLSIPVIASGNIFSAQDAIDMIKKTKVDAVLVARGSFGNPWIFNAIEELAQGKNISFTKTAGASAKIMRYHMKELIAFYGEHTGTLIFRKMFVYYTKGFANIKHLRRDIFKTMDLSIIRNNIDIFENTAIFVNKAS